MHKETLAQEEGAMKAGTVFRSVLFEEGLCLSGINLDIVPSLS